MKQTTVPMKTDAHLIIKTGADIMIEGIDGSQLTAIVEEGDSFRMKDEGGVIYVQANSDAKLQIPRTASVTIERTGGDANLVNLDSKVEVKMTGGDLTLQHVKEGSIGTVGGDCFCKEIGGAIEIQRSGGDLDGFKVAAVKAQSVGGDIELSAVSGTVDLSCGGDLRLHFDKPELEAAQVHAGGDIFVQVLPETKATLEMTSGDHSIKVNACGQALDLEESEYSLPLNGGGATFTLTAGGDIEVAEGKEATHEFSFVFDDLGSTWRDFGKEIEDKIRESMKTVNHSLKQASWQASEAVQRATEKMHNKEGKIYGFTFDNEPKADTAKAKKGVSDEERMMVLKMLQEKKISVEEAEKLLQALER